MCSLIRKSTDKAVSTVSVYSELCFALSRWNGIITCIFEVAAIRSAKVNSARHSAAIVVNRNISEPCRSTAFNFDDYDNIVPPY